MHVIFEFSQRCLLICFACHLGVLRFFAQYQGRSKEFARD
jgi:hypothetical protein